MIPGRADGDRCVGESLWILVGQPAAAIPTSELLEHDLFDVLRYSSLPQACQDSRRLGDELLSIVLVDPDRVELEQDFEQLVIESAVQSLVAFARRPTLFVFARSGRFVHAANWPNCRLALTNMARCGGAGLGIGTQLASSTRLRSKSKRALPNICLLIIFI